jgi:hypothetical protein
MSLGRKSFSGLLALIFLSVQALPLSAADFQGFSTESDTKAITVLDIIPNGFSFIQNTKVNWQVDETPDRTRFCDEFNTRGCDLDSNASLRITSILPVCATAIENCVESLQFTKSDGSVVNAKFEKYFKGKTFTGIPDLNMPGGSRPSLWIAAGAPNAAGTEKYVVNTSMLWNYSGGRASVIDFQASVYAIQDKFSSGYTDSGINTGPNLNGKFGSYTNTGEINFMGTCIATESGYCAERVEFSPNTRINLKLKLSNKVTGWLQGRISSPSIDLTTINSFFNSLSVNADVVEVPMMYAQFKKSEASALVNDAYENKWSSSLGFNGRSEWRQFGPNQSVGMELVNALSSAAKDTAAEVRTYWNVSSLPITSSNPCMADTSKLIGFVTTNAMAYSGSAPTWDGSSLQYKVAGLHYLPDGKTLATGKYDLVMRSESARCLYGFTNAPISATISIASADGEQKVATTVVNEKNGWLYLAASGFTFSAPVINIKLTQEAIKKEEVKADIPAPVTTTPKVAAKLTTIKCVKGGTTKTIKAIKPKCPAGYRLKK